MLTVIILISEFDMPTHIFLFVNKCYCFTFYGKERFAVKELEKKS